MEREVHAEFEAYETERMPRRVRSKEELRLDGEERRGILRSLVVGGVVAVDSRSMSGSALGGDMSVVSDDVGLSQGSALDGNRECCRVYSQEELRKAERRLTRERACNSRAHRRMNRGFFQPLTAQERESGDIVAAAREDGDASPDDDVLSVEAGVLTPTIVEAVHTTDVSPIKGPTMCPDSAANEDI
jgi:hypothetical protein